MGWLGLSNESPYTLSSAPRGLVTCNQRPRCCQYSLPIMIHDYFSVYHTRLTPHTCISNFHPISTLYSSPSSLHLCTFHSIHSTYFELTTWRIWTRDFPPVQARVSDIFLINCMENPHAERQAVLLERIVKTSVKHIFCILFKTHNWPILVEMHRNDPRAQPFYWGQ